jgi:hypothetical protein
MSFNRTNQARRGFLARQLGRIGSSPGKIPISAQTSPRSELRPTALMPQTRSRHIFYPGMALTIATVVGVGFGPTIGVRLIHPPSPRPFILHLHVVLFVTWVLLLIVQTLLVRSRRIDWHRRLGVVGLIVGTSMPIVGITTALVMTRLAGNGVEGQAALAVSFFDMFAFATTFGLAMCLRRRPDYHRRLILMASCGLTVAAFARFPSWLMPNNVWYLGVDILIVAALIRDLAHEGRLHPVYGYGLPALMIGQGITMWVYLRRASVWLVIARGLLS